MNAGSASADDKGAGEAPGAIVFASGNAGKLRELDALLSPLGYRARAQGEFGIEPVEETATTFVENALLKARHASRIAALPAIADDSGLEVDALGGAPGLYSARYAARHGRGEGDAANNAFLLEQLDGVEPERRTARFRSVVVLLRHPQDPSPVIAEGVWEGHVLESPVSGGGFGYDPLFRSRDSGEAASRLAPELKNRLSHRGKAVAALIEALPAALASLSRDATGATVSRHA